MATAVTIFGAAGALNTVTMNSAESAVLAQQIASAINAAFPTTLNAVNFPGPFAPVVGDVNEAVVTLGGGAGPYAGPAGFQYVVNAETVPVVINAAPSQTVLSGNGGGTFTLAGDGQLVLGGGDSGIGLSGSGNAVSLADGNNTIFGGNEANSTISAGTGAVTMFGSSGAGNQFFLSSGTSDFIGGPGSDSLIAGTGNATVFGGTGPIVVFGNTGTLTFVGAAGPSTVVGGATGPTLFGSVGSDTTYFGASNALYVAGLGNETLNASASTGNNQLFGGATGGLTTMVGGSGADTLTGNTGVSDMTGGAGADVFAFFASAGPGADFIRDFQSDDLVLLSGYGPNGVASSVSAGGNTTLTLTDGTGITFVGLANVDQAQIIKTTDVPT